MSTGNGNQFDLLERRLYSLAQTDRLLGLRNGTAKRWIEGYWRKPTFYPPVVRPEPTGDETVTWGEFVETRLLAEYRSQKVPMNRLRPAVERLRERFQTKYPLAHAKPYLDVAGRELVLEIQDSVGLDRHLHLVVVRNDQVVLAEPAERFSESATFREHDGVVELLRPATDIYEVEIDPLRRFGEPVVRAVPTEVIAEQFQAGDAYEAIASLYDLPLQHVQAAVRYELRRAVAAA